MKRKTFIKIFIAVHIFFIVFQIYKHSNFVNLSYQKQQNEAKKLQLVQQIQNLKQRRSSFYQHNKIKKFAQKKLKLHKTKLSQLKKIKLL